MASKEVGSYRENLAGAILGEENPSRALNLLLSVNVPLKDKFKVLDFPTILVNNSESLDSLKRLTTSLEILEHCGKILLKPDEDRPETWRLIEHSSLTMKGGLHVLKLMGYSELTPEELAFLEGAQPDFMETLDLVIDIVIARREIEAYMNDCHPNPSWIKQNLLSQITMATSEASNHSFHDGVNEVLSEVCFGSDEDYEDVIRTLAPADTQIIMATSEASNHSFHDGVNEVLSEVCFGSDEYYDDVIRILAPADTQKFTIDQRFGDLPIFKNPLQLIDTDEDNKLIVNDQAISQLSSIDVALNIVAVTGLYRTGKSYLMNSLANEKKGFVVGSRVAAQTKGIWVWCRRHPQNPEEVLLLLDTEGMSDPNKGDTEHDNRLVCLTILLSSIMIYNHSGIFNHDSLQKLSFVTRMTESIRVAKDMDISDDENDDNIRLLTPTFIMCLRDFYLELKNDDDHVYEDANEFFEARLEVTNEVGKVSNDEIGKCIRKYFPKRRCFTISKPAMNKKLAQLETMRDDELDKDFIKDIDELKTFVYGCEAKVFDALTTKPADGVVFEAFLRTYVNALNLGKTMTFTQAYERASALHNGKMVVTLVREYRQEVDAITLPVEKKQDLQEKCMVLQKTKLRELRKKLFPYKMDSFDDEATKKMEKIRIEKMDKNKEETQQVLALHNGKMVVTLVREYRQEVDAITLPVEKKQDLQEKCMVLQKTKLRELRKKLFPYKMDSFDDEATKKMEKIRIEKMDKNKEETQQVLASIFASLHDQVVNEKMLKKEYDNKFGLTLYRQDMEDIELKFHQQAKNFDLDERQTAFLAYKKHTKDLKFKVELDAKLREERNETLRLEMKAALKKHLEQHLDDIKQEKESVMKLELERMKQNYNEAMVLEKIRRKGFWEKVKILFSS